MREMAHTSILFNRIFLILNIVDRSFCIIISIKIKFQYVDAALKNNSE